MSRSPLTLLLLLLCAGSAQSVHAEQSPQPAFTGIRGQLTDAKTGEPLMVAPVTMTSGASGMVETDLEGRFEIPLAPGTYSLRIWADGYVGKDVVGTQVVPGRVTRVDLALAPIEAEVMSEEIVVTAKVDDRKAETVLLDRKIRATVSDGVSAEEMSRTTDGNAAEAVKRVVGATMMRDRSISLRGLGGRYATTLVNGVALPSADPDGHQAPLDLLPTSALRSLTVHKSYGAELPGAFAGGALSVETNTYPESLEIKAKLSSAFNSAATLQSRNGYRGGSLDFFGIDDGTRALPTQAPAGAPLTPSAARELAPAFTDIWSVERTGTIPRANLGVSVGDTVPVGRSTVGYLAAAGFSHDESSLRSRSVKPDAQGGALSELSTHRGAQGASMNAVLSAGWKLDHDTDVGLLSLYTRRGESVAEVSAGEVGATLPEAATRLGFSERSLLFSQLRGRHRLADGDDGTVGWQLNHSMVNANEPDRRDIVYELLPDGRERFKNGPGSAERFFSTLSDQTVGGSVDYRRRFSALEVAVGASAQHASRTFDARRFRYALHSGATPSNLFLPPTELLASDRLATDFTLREDTLFSDSYTGALGVYGTFASVQLQPVDPLRVSAGVRGELATQSITAASPYYGGAAQTPRIVERTDPAIVPTLNAVYALSPTQNLRAGYSYTTVRPQFRELSPVLYRDLVRRRNVTGNPDLLPSRIHNADVRWEWFPSSLEVISASAFFKRFNDPIEQVVVGAPPELTFRNTPGAMNGGIELEGRFGLARFTPVLSDFEMGANVSLIRSEVIRDETETITAAGRRPLQGQAPWVVNVSAAYVRESLGLEVAVQYNVVGPTLAEVGSNFVPDAYEQPFHAVDLSVSKSLRSGLRLRLTGQNLLNQEVVVRQAGVDALRYHPGVSGSLALEWSH